MKVLLINGSMHNSGASFGALKEIKNEILKLNADFSEYSVGTSPRYACSCCGSCRDGNGCVHGDIDSLCELCSSANAIIICTPTHYASAPGNLTSVLSRLVFSKRSSIEHKPIGIASVGRRAGLCDAAHDVKKIFEFASCSIVSGSYPSILYAKDFESVKLDDEGLQNMRSLANNVVYIARCMEIGSKNGILPPDEPRIYKTDISTLGKR